MEPQFRPVTESAHGLRSGDKIVGVNRVERERFLRLAVALATANVRAGHGGPFGAVVVREGEVIATGVNEVTRRSDPTAHAEIQAIRAACRRLRSFQLTGCDLFASSEPCPMCFGALCWARPRAVYYAYPREAAAAAGFDDQSIYEQLPLPPGERLIPMVRFDLPGLADPFAAWQAAPGKIAY
jgi:guanine deaminase